MIMKVQGGHGCIGDGDDNYGDYGYGGDGNDDDSDDGGRCG